MTIAPACPVCPVCPVCRQAGDRQATGRRQAGGRQVSTGPLEGTNTKIRVLQRQAYGFRDTEFFKLKIYALHETHYELVG